MLLKDAVLYSIFGVTHIVLFRLFYPLLSIFTGVALYHKMLLLITVYYSTLVQFFTGHQSVW